MRLRNQILLIGRLGQDPEHRTLESGAEVVRFSLATSESYKNKQGEKVEETQWHTCVAWRQLAGIINNLAKKGMQVAVRGKMTYRKWEKDGIQRTSAEVVVDEFLILDSREAAQTSEPSATPTAKVTEDTAKAPSKDSDTPDDELPF
jgi:single-strand DNA-binding protein